MNLILEERVPVTISDIELSPLHLKGLMVYQKDLVSDTVSDFDFMMDESPTKLSLQAINDLRLEEVESKDCDDSFLLI
jgi:hypothetical protein